MSFLVDLLLILPIVLVMAYFGASASMMLLSILLGIAHAMAFVAVLVGLIMGSTAKDKKFSLRFWLPYLIIITLCAISFVILIPVHHLAGYISWLEVPSLWLVVIFFFCVFVSIPFRYLGKLDAERSKDNPPSNFNHSYPAKSKTWADFFQNKFVLLGIIILFTVLLLNLYLWLFGYIRFLEFVSLTSFPIWIFIYLFIRANSFRAH